MRILHRPALLLSVSLAMASTACRKEDDAPPSGQPAPVITEKLLLAHHIDGDPLVRDTIRYMNEAGHAYSITRLEYYISQITLLGATCCGTPDHIIPGPFYINAAAHSPIDLGQLPAGEYRGATLLLGLPPVMNQTGALPNTPENSGMAWPDQMGGGYHFLKFEGHFLNGITPTGYAMHLGRNENLVVCDLPQSFALDGQGGTFTLRFNLNEVFRSPNTYELPSGSYSMGSAALMGLLRDNCADAFTIEHDPS